jgi:hypothetical protein
MLTIKLMDGTLLKEPELDWNSILPTQIIRYMEYKIVDKKIRLVGYDRYLRLKEIARGINCNFQAISNVILIGQSGSMCTRVTIDLIKGVCSKAEVPFDKVYNNKPIADNYWKVGLTLDNPNVYTTHD